MGSTPSIPTKFRENMKVSLVSYTHPSTSFLMNSDVDSLTDMIAYCARVSNPQNQNNSETSERLIKYLMKHKHWSPFEMVNVCLEIETTRDIARQILRHRSFSFQEFSQRYADPTKDLEFDFRHARFQDPSNRQNSIDCQDLTLEADWVYRQQLLIDVAEAAYNWARENNIAKEQARAVLPEGLMMSRLYMNGTLRSWIHYIQLRTHKDTQLEHREVAEECKKVIEKIFPMINEL